MTRRNNGHGNGHENHGNGNGNGHHSHGNGNGYGHDHNDVPCFVAGSIVYTKKGPKLVENVKPGDYIMTMDNGFQEVSWSGTSISNESPVSYKNTTVSKNHRFPVNLDGEERLIAAKFLVDLGEAFLLDRSKTTYVHFMFEKHQIVNVDGVWSESFRPGPYIMKNMGRDQAEEIYKLFPELRMGLIQEPARKPILRKELSIA